jgi:hypothetical protein
MRILYLVVLLLPLPIFSQPVIAPTPEAAGSPQGENMGPFNITNSFEAGYRFHAVDGNEGKYRSDVNFGNGIRLLRGTMAVHSRNGKGRWLDELLVDVQGLGNDPYQFSSVRLQKNALYRYDLVWRLSDYFNPALTIARGNQFLSTTRRLQDHDLTLFPQSRIKLHLGFTGNAQTGAGLSTGQWFDTRGDEFAFTRDVRRSQNEYRIGTDIRWRRWNLSVRRGWEAFKDDTRFARPLAPDGANPSDRTTLTSLRRDEPYHGRTPFWRILLLGDLGKGFSLQGRFTHSDGERAFVFDELAQGTDRLGSARQRQILIAGSGRRPFTTASLGLVWLAPGHWTFSNQTAYSNVRMEGDGRYSELANGSLSLSRVSFQNFGVQLISNTSEASWQPVKPLGMFGNFHYSDRRIRSTAIDDIELPRQAPISEQSNRQKAGTLGLRLQPIEPVRILLRAEVGRNDTPFYPTSDKDYTAYLARVSYRSKKGSASTSFQSFSNTNSTSLFLHSSRGRTWTANAGWSPRPGIYFDAGYQYQHLETLTGLAYFANFELIENTRSYYLSNLHTFHLTSQWRIAKRADVFASIVRSKDLGDGRPILDRSFRPDVLGDPATAPTFAAAQVYPLTYLSPSARISLSVHSKLRLNLGWQYYDYAEYFLSSQDYRAHTGFVSISYSF